MCTLSIIKIIGAGHDDGLVITMNRDERRSRHEAAQPVINRNNPQQNTIIYPQDLHAGGSWFGVSDAGIVLGLLNRYQNPVYENLNSRGEIIPLLLSSGDLNHILSRLETLPFRHYNAFDLIMISTRKSYRFCWDGENTRLTLLNLEKAYFISSSSVDRERVLLWRESFFNGYIKQKSPEKLSAMQILRAIHLQQIENHKSRSIFMSRRHSHTKSICQVVLSETSLQFNYFPQKNLKQLKYSAGEALSQQLQLSIQ